MPAINQLRNQIRDAGVFLREFVSEFHDTGSITPSSSALSTALTRFVAERPPGASLDILEVGAGTGPVTKAIARHMSPRDTLEVVESNERLVERLREVLHDDPALAAADDRITLRDCRVEELDSDERFDVIISGLPFANFTAEEVSPILEQYIDMLRPGGHLSFYGYLATKQIRAVIAPREDYLRQVRSGWVVEEFVNRYGVAEDRVMANIPPAWIHHLRKPVG